MITTMPKKISIKGHERPAKIDVLEIKNLHAEIENQKILKGINLTIKSGEIHAIMGPNGSGKSTLCKILMGHPSYKVTKGKVTFNGKNILKLEPNERANLGIFLGFQHPLEIPGVTLGNFMRLAKNATKAAAHRAVARTAAQRRSPRILHSTSPFTPLPLVEFMKEIKATAESLKMDPKFIGRSVNEGSSGGERKRAEILQMSVLEPKIALLDEIDSGLDIDALKIVATGINDSFKKNSPAILLVTHYQRILNYITPHFVHVISAGRIVKSGGKELALQLEAEGYENFTK